MGGEIARRELADRRHSLVWWALGILAFLAMIAAIYPSIEGQEGMQDAIDQYPESMLALFGIEDLDVDSAASWLDSYLFASMLPLLLLIYAIGFGASAIAGEQQSGRLDLVLSYPMPRRRYLMEKSAVLLTTLALFGAAVFVLLWVGDLVSDYGIPVSRLAAASAALAALALVFGTLALAVGSWTLQRSSALGVTAGLAVVTYLVSSFSTMAGWLEPLRPLSPFHWYGRDNVLETGVDWLGLGLLVALSAVLVIAALALFERRDLTT